MSTKKLQIIGDFSAKDGEDGFSPIANVAKTDDGVVISITDKEGTTTAIVNDGHDGRGIDYIDNPDGDNALWIHYTDGNADVVFLPAGGEIDPGAGGGGGGGIDMTGYAKETWVQEGFQPKGDYLKSAELPTVIDTALLQAKASGEFDGKDGKTPVKGTDYFTEADKQEIAGQAAALVDAKNTCWVHITYNSETGVGTTDKTSEEINAEYNSGKYVVCTAEIDGFPFELVPVFVATPNVLFNCTYDHRNYTLTIRGDVVEFDERTSVVSVNNLKPDVYGRINIPIPEAIDGVSPTVDVSKSGKVTTISITDKNGTKTATVNDGADGADGKDAEGFLRVVLDQETMTADHNAVEITEVVSNGGFAYLVVNSAGEMVKLTRAVGSLATFTRTNFYSLDGEVVIIEEADYTVDVNGQVTVSSAVFSDRGNVKSVNGQTPDKNGNVEITIPDSVDLTGYAKESWVQAGFQPKGSYYTKEEIDTLVENFEPSAFIVTTDGTTADKTNAEMWEAYQKARPTYLLLMADTGAYLAQPVTATATKAVFNSNLGEASVTVTIENGSVSVSVYGYADSEAFSMLSGQVSSLVNSKLDASALPTAISTALAQAKASGEFDGADGKDGYTPQKGVDYFDGSDGKDGYTPVKGKDYWTDADKEEMMDALAHDASIKNFGAVGDGVADDTSAFKSALASTDVVNVTKGTYILSDTITIRSGCKMVLDRDVHLKFTQTNKHCIVMQKFAILDGGNGSISVPSGFTKAVIVFDSELDGTDKTDVFPYANWNPMQKYGRTVRNLDIVRTLPNGRLESDDGSCSGTAIYLHTSTATNHDFLWACIIDHVNISGAFSYGIRAKNDGGWINDTKMESVYIDSCEVGVSLENMKNTYVDCIIQPRKAINGAAYAKHGLKLVNSQHCYALGLKVWDWDLASTGDEYNPIAMYGNCSDFVFADMTYDNYAKASDFWTATIYTDTPSNLENTTLINEPNTKWFFNNNDIPYFRKESGTERLATFADLEANFGTSIVPNFEDWLSTAIDRDGTVYNGTGYKKQCRVDMTSGNVVDQSDDTYTATGFIHVKNNDVIRFANFSVPVDGYCGYVVYDSEFTRLSHITSQALTNESNTAYFEVVKNENGDVVQFKLRSVTAAAYIRLTTKTRWMFANPMVSVNEEITYSTYGSLSPDIAVDYNSLFNVPKPLDLSIYQSKNIIDMGGYFATDTVDGALQEVGGKVKNIPTKVSQLTNDAGFITGYTETDPTVPSWAKASSKPSYTKTEVGLGNVDNVRQYSASNPPPYPVTSVNGKTGAVTIDIPNMSNYQTKTIVDSGGYFGTDTVDGALQEIGSQLNGLAAALEALL